MKICVLVFMDVSTTQYTGKMVTSMMPTDATVARFRLVCAFIDNHLKHLDKTV